MSSKNPTSAVNQQERLLFEKWIVGFVDGEGCFSISVVRNASMSHGWQVQHEFAVVQSATSGDVLELIETYFGCGSILKQKRKDSRRSDLWRFSVKNRKDLQETIIPFFIANPLLTSKQNDFALFYEAVTCLHSSIPYPQKLHICAAIAEKMNRKKKSRFLESSEAIRQLTCTTTS
jgi:hypothetical protein